jgi:hypothetical protein
MRTFGILLDKAATFREPTIPCARLERVNPPPPVRRLDEEIVELFNLACAANDLQAAVEILALIEKWHGRRSYADEQERRLAGMHLKRMHAELERRYLMKGLRPAGSRLGQTAT